MCPLARTNDHADAALTPGDTPRTPAQDPQSTRASARQVKRQAKAGREEASKMLPLPTMRDPKCHVLIID
jgi:hypothetical protein